MKKFYSLLLLLLLIPFVSAGWVYRQNITNVATVEKTFFSVNGTNSWNGLTVYYSPQKSGTTAVYYNDTSTYAVLYNDTTTAPFLTSKNGLNNTIESISNYHLAITFDTNGTYNDISSSHYNTTINAASRNLAGNNNSVFGGSIDMTNSYDGFNITETVNEVWNTWGYWFRNTNSLTTSSAEIVGGGLSGYSLWFGFGGTSSDIANEVILLEDGTLGDCTGVTSITIPSSWHLLVYKWNGAKYEIYLDGVNQTTAACSAGHFKPVIRNQAVGFGYRVSDHYADFNGQLDQLFITNQNLSSADIMQMYINGINNLTAGGSGLLAAENITGAASPEPPTVTFSTPTPVDATKSNAVNFTINATINSTKALSSVSFNGTIANVSLLDAGLVAFYNFDNVTAIGDSATKAVDLSGNSYNFTINGNTTYGVGKYINSLWFDGIRSNISYSSSLSEINISKNYTVAFWIYPLGTTNGMIWQNSHSGSARNGCYISSSFNLRCGEYNGTAYNSISKTIVINTWQHVIFTHLSNGSMEYYIDGINPGHSTSSTSLTGEVGLKLGVKGDGTLPLNASIDEFRVFNRVLSSADALQLYRSNLRKASSIVWQLEVNETDVLSDGVYNYDVYAYNTDGNDNAGSRSITLDTQNPTINVLTGNEFSNNTYTGVYRYLSYDAYDRNVRLNFSFTDERDLFGVEILGYDGNGVLFFNYTNLSLSGLKSFNYSNASINVTNKAAGVYTLNVSVADSHTALSIDDYAVAKDVNSLVFDTKEGNIISITSDAAVSADAIKSVDRYSFSFSYPAIKDAGVVERVYNVRSLSGGRVVYLPKSRYKAHFVIFNKEGFGGNWVDFEGYEGTPAVKCLTDTYCTVTFTEIVDEPVKEEVVSFNSVGGLNVVDADYQFFVGNYSSSTIEGLSGVTKTAWLNLSSGNFEIVNSTMIFNTVTYTPTVSDIGEGYNVSQILTLPVNATYSLLWTLNVRNIDGSVWQSNISSNLTSYYWNISLCSGAFGNNTLRFFFWHETIPTLNLTTSMDLGITLWSVYNDNLTRNFNLTGGDNYTLCLYSNVTLYTDLYASFSRSDGFTNRYYWFNQTLNGSQKNVNLYVFNDTTGISNLRITARDSDSYAYYPFILGVLERRYLGEGVWRSVQMDLSDDYGLIFFNVIEESEDYRIKFYDNFNHLLKTSDNLKFSCDSGTCELIALITPYGATVISSNLAVTYSFNNVTNILTVNWSDSEDLVTSVRIMVAKETITGELLLFNVTAAGSSGGYALNLSGITGDVLVRVSKSASPESSGFTFWLRLTTARLLSSVVDADEGMLWAFFILLVIVLLGAYSPVASIIFAVVGLIALLALGLVSVISITVIILAVIMALVLAFKINR